MNNRLTGLNILSNFKNTDWKIGQSDFYINSITSKVSTLPQHFFDHFYINNDSSKAISIVDFALITYDMGITERTRLMELYGIEPQTIDEIMQAADSISEFLDSLSKTSSENVQNFSSIDSKNTLKAHKTDNDEIDV